MIRKTKGHAVVELMGIDREIRAAFSKLVGTLSYYNDDQIDLEKAKIQFKEMTHRAIRDFEQDMRTFSPEMDSDREMRIIRN